MFPFFKLTVNGLIRVAGRHVAQHVVMVHRCVHVIQLVLSLVDKTVQVILRKANHVMKTIVQVYSCNWHSFYCQMLNKYWITTYLLSFLVDCKWNEWSSWDTCSKTCGNGTQMRSRNSTGPMYGGQNCTGENEENQSCNSFDCPGIVSFSFNLLLFIQPFQFSMHYSNLPSV